MKPETREEYLKREAEERMRIQHEEDMKRREEIWSRKDYYDYSKGEWAD